MLLEPLVATIQNLKRSIEAHETSLRENEIRTRMALIDPLLSILGWDTSDPELVLPEYTVSGRADYALLKPDGRPAAFIEAKKLGEPLEQHRMQMLNYSNAAGVDYAGLTNGNQWEFYSVFERGTLDQRLLLQTNIVSANPYHCALGFLLLWRPNLASGDPTKAPVPALAPLPVDTPSPPRGEHSLSQTHSAMSSRACRQNRNKMVDYFGECECVELKYGGSASASRPFGQGLGTIETLLAWWSRQKGASSPG